MNLKERIAKIQKIGVTIHIVERKIIPVADKTTAREIEMLEIITLQQEIIESKDEIMAYLEGYLFGLNTRFADGKMLFTKHEMESLAKTFEEHREKTKEKTGE